MKSASRSITQLLNACPLAPVFGAVCTGIIINGWLHLPIIGVALPALLALACYWRGSILRSRLSTISKGTSWFWCSISLMFIAIGMLAGTTRGPSAIDIDGEVFPPVAHGTVIKVTHGRYTDNLLINITSLQQPSSGIVRATPGLLARVYVRASEARAYDIVEFTHNLKAVSRRPSNRYNQDDWLRKMGIVAVDNVASENMKIVGREHGLRVWCNDMREALLDQVDSTPLDGDTKEFLAALIFADTENLDPDVRRNFSEAGLSHILALSGMHLAVVASLIWLLLWPIRAFVGYKVLNLFVVLAVWIFVLIVGMPVSAVRAAIMFSILMLSQVLERRYSSFNALCLAGLIIVLFSPHALFEPAFQLSWVCVAIFILYSVRIQQHSVDLLRKFPVSHYISGTIMATLIAVLGSWPIVAYYFHSFQPLFLVSNFPVVILLPAYIVAAIIYLSAYSMGIHLVWIAWILDKSYGWLSGNLLPALSDSALILWVGATTPILWLAALFVGALALRTRSKWMCTGAGALAVMSVITIFIFPSGRPADALWVGSRSDVFEIVGYKDGREQRQELSLARNHSFIIDGRDWIVLSTPGRKELECFKGDTCEYLVIANQCTASAQDIVAKFHPKVVVIHPSVFSNRHGDLHTMLRLEGVAVHNLQEDGPLYLPR